MPAEKIDAWPRNGEKYLPIEARDFDAWVRSANDSASARVAGATIHAAEYTARLDSSGRLQGDARWTIELRGAKPAFLLLGNLSLVMSDAHWQDSPKQPVRLGLWGRNGHEPSRFGLEVGRSGVLAFTWHIQTHSTDDHIEVPWLVPTANTTRLVLDLPEGKQPRIDGGVVLESSQPQSDGRTQGKLLRHWVIAISPSAGTTWRVANTDRTAPETSAKLAMREDVKYQATLRGLDMTAVWQLDGSADQKRELTIPIPKGLKLTAVKADGHDLAWHTVHDSASLLDSALVELPPADRSEPLQITLDAWQPLVTDTPWRLPRLRPEGVFWSSGSFEISIAAAYELQTLEPADCVQTSVRSVKATDAPEIYELSAYSPSAAIDIRLSRRQSDATIRAGSSLSLADPDLNGKLVTQWNLSRGATHKLIGKLAVGWAIEAVESIPADAMGEWFINRHGDGRQIEIQLSHAASSAQTISIIITGRLQRFSLAEPISAETMRMVAWDGARTAKHLLTFQSSEPFAVEPVGKLPVVASENTPNNDRALLDQTTDNTIFDLTNAAKGAGLQLAFKRGPYSAKIDLDVSCTNQDLQQEYRLAIQPASSPIDRLLVYSTGRLGESVRWTLSGSKAPLTAERLAPADALRATLPKEGEVWLVRLPQPTSHPIELAVSTTIRRPQRTLVPLLSLPEATQQEGRVLIRCRSQKTLWLEPARLQTIPLPSEARPTSEFGNRPPVCAAFRYQPADCRDAVRPPKLSASAASDSEAGPFPARRVHLESFYWPDGSGTHCATYQLENRGETEFKLTLPAEVRLVTASLDNHLLNLARPNGSGQPAVFRLPSLERSANLSLYFETRGPPLTAGRELVPPPTLNELPFLTGDWIVWLPDEYSAMGTGLSDAAPKFNWRQRLFGPLGRPNGAQPFNPLRLADGIALINGPAEGNIAEPQTESSRPQPQPKATDRDRETSITPVTPSVMPPPGWHSYQESFIANRPTPIVVLHPPATTAWAVVVLLTCYLGGQWVRRRHADVFAIAIALAASAALLLPTAYADLAAGAVLGLLLSLVAYWPRRSISPDDFVLSRWTNAAVASTVAVAIAVGLTRLSLAQSPKDESLGHNTSPPKIYRLLIPTDASGKPSGTKYFVSEQFLRVLLAADANAAHDDGRWLLRDAAYSGELRENPGGTDIVAGNWTMNLSIETLARDTTIVLPLVRNEAEWTTTVMLDGVPLPLEWNNQGHKRAMKIAEPGRYSLAVSCLPTTTITEGRNQIDLPIQPLLGALVELRFPVATAGLHISNASVLPPSAGDGNILNGELDRSDRLKVQWSRSNLPENGRQGLNVTELRWLDIKPADTELRVKYVLEGGARRPDSITVAYDERWKLLAHDKSMTNERSNATFPGQRLIHVPAPPHTADRQEILLHFQLRVPPALGNLRLPPVDLISIPANKRWLAVSTDPSRECEIADSAANDGTVNEFFAKWGTFAKDVAPQLVLSNLDPSRTLTLAIRPRETEAVIDDALNVAAGIDTLRVNYEAKVTPGTFGAFRFALSVPANLSISEITAAEADQQIPLRWSRSADNRVHVFFGQKIANSYRLVLNGSLPVDPGGKASLPRVSALATEAATEKVRLYRDDDVQVELNGLSGSIESKSESVDPPPPEWTVRPVAVCYLDNNSPDAARFAVKPNGLKIGGQTLTALTRENGAWWANYRCQLLVEEGDLDLLRLRVPNTWTGPFDVQSPAPVSTDVHSMNEQGGVLAIRFATSVAKGSSVDLRIRAPLRPSTGATVVVPAIVPESLSHCRRYISVPDSADSQQISWTETGVQGADIPPKLLAGFAGATPSHSFEIVHDPFQIASQSQATPEASPQIRMADTAVIAGTSGTQLVATRLILAPHGLSECMLQLPNGQKLVAIELDGRPALIRSVDQSHWQVALGAPELPQSLEIVSRSAAENVEGDPVELQRPVLLAYGKPIPAEVSLWSFAHPSTSMSRHIDGADEVGAVEQAALRFDRLVSMAEAAKITAIELSPPDGYNWFQPWAKLLTAARSHTQQTVELPHLARAESLVTRTSEDQINQDVERLDKWLDDCRRSLVKPDSEKAAEPPTLTDPSTSSLLAASGLGAWTYYVAEGGNERLVLLLRPPGPTTAQTRIIGLLLINLLLIATLWLARRPTALDFLCRWPHAVGILLGVAFWAWMWPSWLGLLITAGSLWLALRSDWPGRSIRTEASTVLRAAQST